MAPADLADPTCTSPSSNVFLRFQVVAFGWAEQPEHSGCQVCTQSCQGTPAGGGRSCCGPLPDDSFQASSLQRQWAAKAVPLGSCLSQGQIMNTSQLVCLACNLCLSNLFELLLCAPAHGHCRIAEGLQLLHGAPSASHSASLSCTYQDIGLCSDFVIAGQL